MSSETKEFFETLYKGIHSRKSKLQIFLINMYKDYGEKGHIIWKFFTNIDEAIEYALKMDEEKRYHIYFRCPELKADAETGKESDLLCHPFLYADLDPNIKDKDGNIVKSFSKEELLQKIDSFPLSPTFVVNSGNGYHVYWRMAIPLYEKERIKYLLSCIQEALDGDPYAAKITQLLRVPGTHNRKGEALGKEPIPVRIVRRNSKNVYTIDDFYAALDLSDEEDIYALKTSISSSPSLSTRTASSSVYTGDDVIRFDFNKKVEPLNVTVDNFVDLLELLKKQNILVASNIDPSYTGKLFRCCFHPDENPSANVFVSRNGHYLYKCFGCGRIYDIISIYQTLTKKSFAESLKKLASFFGIKCEQSDWVKDQLNKYHQNLVTLLNFEKYDYDVLYPNFYKLLKDRYHYLYYINSFGLGFIRSEKESYQNESIFSMSYEYFTKTFSKNHVYYKTAKRFINLFCTLGLIKKVPIEEVPEHLVAEARKYMEKTAKLKGLKEANLSNFYIVYNIHDRLRIAEERAKILIKNGFKISKTMNKDYLILTFGQEVANEVYPDERTLSKKNQSIANRLEATLIKLISEQGYATKDQIISKTKISGRLKADRKKKEAELEKYFAQMLSNHNLEYVKPTKKLMEEFKLKSATYIIIPKGLKEK